MFRLAVYRCSDNPLPGQVAKILFCQQTLYCPIYDHKDGYIWCFVPKSVQNAEFVQLCGRALLPPCSDKITFVAQRHYFDIFYWSSFWADKIKFPLLIELPQKVSFGKVVPSKFIDNRYLWFSQYIAAIEQIEQIGIAHRVIVDNIPHALSLSEFYDLKIPVENLEFTVGV